MDDELEKIKREKIKKMLEKRKVIEKMKTNPIIKVSDDDFQEKVIEQSKKIPVVVDFWAEWCGPCRMLGPVLEKIAKEYNGKFILAKLNVERNRKMSQVYRIMGIPSVKMFKDGRIVDEFVGFLPEPSIKAWLNKNLENSSEL